MRGLGLSWLWVLGRTSDADNRCPTQLFYKTTYWDFLRIFSELSIYGKSKKVKPGTSRIYDVK